METYNGLTRSVPPTLVMLALASQKEAPKLTKSQKEANNKDILIRSKNHKIFIKIFCPKCNMNFFLLKAKTVKATKLVKKQLCTCYQ